jgi:hypothetical protein
MTARVLEIASAARGGERRVHPLGSVVVVEHRLLLAAPQRSQVARAETAGAFASVGHLGYLLVIHGLN